MTSEDLLAALHRRPFNPFTLHVDEVTQYYVPAPEFVAHKPGSGVAVVLSLRDAGFDRIALSHVSKLSFPDAPVEADMPGAAISSRP